MDFSSLSSLSPLDGRYHHLTQPLSNIFSEASLVSHRLKIEILYLKTLSQTKIIRSFTKKEISYLDQLQKPTLATIKKIKQIEKKIHHDVKAIEYYLALKLKSSSLKDCISFLHFGLTSADINNLSYRLMISSAHQKILLPQLKKILKTLNQFCTKYHDLPMLARTHGQAAIPTTLGKEISVFSIRLLKQLKKIKDYQLTGKLNGAVGSFHALHFIKPEINWPKFSTDFISSLGLRPNLHTTQINPADDIVDLFNSYHLINSILIDLNQDIWRYISDDWLVQDNKKNQVGSSTMPQKINPIQFENSEGNLTLANGLIETINRKLPISRLQRDLSDSTINRNFGTIFGHSLIAYDNLLKGLNSIKPNQTKIKQDLNKNFNILSEALQTWLRYQQDSKAYQKTAKLIKGQDIKQSDWKKLTENFDKKINSLTPSSYTGLSSKLTLLAIKDINKFLETS
ncbi:adenylosuccinate lyase [Patescibacteria group bacterium]|nr:adenylosuccinate lyase [Patescibacteria group bacterium]